ncbi:MAG: hypothetical protein ACRCZS_15980 [Chroococcidiopsis sp.]
MTGYQSDRLDRIETLLAETASLTRSNAVAIQALTDDLVTFKLTVEENIQNARQEREELRTATIGIANLLASLDSDRPTILRKLNTIENKVDQILQKD